MDGVWASSESDVWAVGFDGVFHWDGTALQQIASNEYVEVAGSVKADGSDDI